MFDLRERISSTKALAYSGSGCCDGIPIVIEVEYIVIQHAPQHGARSGTEFCSLARQALIDLSGKGGQR